MCVIHIDRFNRTISIEPMNHTGWKKEKELTQEADNIDAIAINEVQLVLAEKRTSLAVMRTGIAVLALPLSVISVLIATSRYYDIFHVLHFLVPLVVFNLGLIVLNRPDFSGDFVT